MNPSVFHVTHWKAGSQWVRAVLNDTAPHRIVPSEPAQSHFFHAPIIPGAIYTPIYANFAQFAAIVPATRDQRTFVIVRDPRDTLVSWYFSLRYSHSPEHATIPQTRQILQQLDDVDGLAVVLRGELCDAINIQMTWLDAGAKMFRYEDLLTDELNEFKKILTFCEIEISEDRLQKIVARHNFQNVSGRRPGQSDPQSFLRNGQANDWRNHFPDRLTSMFRTLYGEATVRLGYAPSGSAKW